MKTPRLIVSALELERMMSKIATERKVANPTSSMTGFFELRENPESPGLFSLEALPPSIFETGENAEAPPLPSVAEIIALGILADEDDDKPAIVTLLDLGKRWALNPEDFETWEQFAYALTNSSKTQD